MEEALAEAAELRARGSEESAAAHQPLARGARVGSRTFQAVPAAPVRAGGRLPDDTLRELARTQRAEAARHRATAEELHATRARDGRIRNRSAHRHARERRGARRFRPGPGGAFYSPGMIGTAGTTSRYAAAADVALDREIEAVALSLVEHGPTGHEELAKRVGGRAWGPGRFRAALREAINEGRARRLPSHNYGPAGDGDGLRGRAG